MDSFFNMFPSCSPLDSDQVDTNCVKIIPASTSSQHAGEHESPTVSRGFSFPFVLPPFEEHPQDGEESEGGLCRVCRPINMKSQIQFWHVKCYGTVRQIFARKQCAICRLVIWILAQDMGFSSIADLERERPNIECTMHWIINPPGPKVCLTIYTENIVRGFIISQSPHSLALENRRSLLCVDHPTTPESGNLDIVRICAWIRECEQLHGGTCQGDLLDFECVNTNELLLIDVDRWQLVTASSTARYIALSYVWGQEKVFKTTKASLPVVQQEGGLNRFEDQIGQVVKDAKRVVVALGERYLWVDSLCIVQDDEMHKHEQISQMDTVYGQAFLSIIAVAGNTANSRLPGVRPESRMSIPPIETVQNLCLVPQHQSILGILDDSVYESRAWTLQERLLSKRCLFFTGWTVYHQCGLMAYQEDESLYEPKSLGRSPATQNVKSLFTPQSMVNNPLRTTHSNTFDQQEELVGWLRGFTVYRSLIETYTKRNLTYSSDILNAFYGIGKSLGKQYGGRLINGIPEPLLDLALLWSPGTVALQRQQKSSSTGSKVMCFPSWTWAGWEGAINFVLPTNILQHSKPTKASLRVEIGMLRIGSFDDNRPVERETISGIIEHPVCSPCSSKQSQFVIAHDIVLSFCATVSPAENFRIRGQQVYHLQEPLPATRILDDQGRHCGLLLTEEKSVSISRWSLDSAYEFVLLSSTALFDLHPFFAVSLCLEMGLGFIYEPIFDGRFYQLREGEMKLVNVMLIAWSKGFAERVAIGCIHKDAWMKAGRKRKDIRLV